VRSLSRRLVLHRAVVVSVGSGLGPVRAVAGERLAIRGYDPVAYFTDGKPVQGSPEIEYVWDGQRYRFTTAAHRDLFKADPVRYAPQFADFCAMSLTKGELVVADPENWLVSDGKLYLFGKSDGPALFRQNLTGNIERAHENDGLLNTKP
jgi:YHS domain-containing protein